MYYRNKMNSDQQYEKGLLVNRCKVGLEYNMLVYVIVCVAFFDTFCSFAKVANAKPKRVSSYGSGCPSIFHLFNYSFIFFNPNLNIERAKDVAR